MFNWRSSQNRSQPPREPEPAKSAPAADLKSTQSKADTVLVVDDEADILRLIQFYLKTEGLTVLTAENGARALELVASQRPDLVVLDVMMPDMSGLEVCERLRRQPGGGALPIIMLSALSHVPDKVKGLEAGADEYVTKPVDMAELAARVKGLLARTRRLRPDEAPGRSAQVVGFVGAKGGGGVTTTALNVATLLAQGGSSVLFLDLSNSLSALSNELATFSSKGLPALLSMLPEMIAAEDIQTQCTETSFGFLALLAAQTAEGMQDLSPDHLATILSLSRSLADLVIVDLPIWPLAAGEKAMQACQVVLIVVEPQVGALKSALLALDLFRNWMDPQAVLQIVVNNRGGASTDFTTAELAEQLGFPILSNIPYARDLCASASEQGVPVALYAAGSVIALSYATLVDRMQRSLIGKPSAVPGRRQNDASRG